MNINEAAEAVLGTSGLYAVGWIATVHDRGDGTVAVEVVDWQPDGRGLWAEVPRFTVEATNDEWIAAVVRAAQKHGALPADETTP